MKKILFIVGIVILTMSNLSLKATSLQLTIPELLGQIDEAHHPDFQDLSQTSIPVSKPHMFLRQEVIRHLKLAYQDFHQQYPNIPFVIVSATRNYYYQKSIWNKKWIKYYSKTHNDLKTAKMILEYSSMPGTSRHHWGTDVDITDLNSDYFHHDPQGKILFAWLEKNMPRYGFCQPFNAGRTRGYKEEEWHWSYKPLSLKFLNQYRAFLQKKPNLKKYFDFLGAQHIPLNKLIEEYVFSINPQCKH